MKMRKKKLFGVGVLIIMTVLAAALPTLGAIQELSYDSFNNATNISYDGLNRILAKNFSLGQHNYSYDGEYLGTLTNVTFTNGTIAYEYDDKLRVTKEARVIDGIRFEKSFSYDSANRIVRLGMSPGNETKYLYSLQGLIDKISGFINSTRHNALGNVLNRTYASGKVTNFTYDSRNTRLTRVNTDTVQNLFYDYDKVGNMMMINDSANDRLLGMGYDYLDRLANTTINGGQSFLYRYDAIGNLHRIVRHSTNSTTLFYGGGPVHAPSKIITGNANVDIHLAAMINSSNKSKVLEFFLANERNETVNVVNWSAEFGDGSNTSSTTNFNLTKDAAILVLVEHNYSAGGNYAVNITAGSPGSSSDIERVSAKFGLHIDSLSIVSRNITNISYEFAIRNDLNENTQDATWECNNGLTSGGSITVNATTTRTISLTYNYSSAGARNLSCSVSSGNGNAAKSTSFEIKGLEIEAYNRTNINGSAVKISFNVTNHFFPTTANYRIVSDGQTFTGTTTSIGTETSAIVSQEISYTTSGTKGVDINVTSSDSNLSDTLSDRLVLKALEIENYTTINVTPTTRIFDFWIKNYWPSALSSNWNVSDPPISGEAFSLNSSESVRVLIEANYSTQGTKRPVIKAYSGSHTNSLLERFAVKLVQIVSYQTIVEGTGSTITEAFVQSNNESRNISWSFNTGSQAISSINSSSLDAGEDVMLIIESSYSESNVYNTSLFVNSSSNNDSATGVIVT